jgi:glycosyltransferase involved in cell wall biosynthesis
LNVRVLVTSTFVTSFIQNDVTLLKKHYDVDHLVLGGPWAPTAIAFRGRHADVLFSWFASTYAGAAVGFARSTGKKSIVAVGGADVACLPEIGYGLWLSRWKGLFAGFALRHADRVLAVDVFLRAEAMARARYDGRNIEVLPTGYDTAFWTPGSAKQPIVLTVAACDSVSRLKVKGIDVLFDAARVLPDYHFMVVGLSDSLRDGLRKETPPNVEVRSSVPAAELLPLYQKAKVYCQTSRIEGLPNAVCEAMLCGCITVCTDVGGVRTAVGEEGFLVPSGDATAVAGAIMKAMESKDDRGLAARDSIASRFPLERREEGLIRSIEGVMQ